MSNLDITRKLAPQNGWFRMLLGSARLLVRVGTFPLGDAIEAAALRLQEE